MNTGIIVKVLCMLALAMSAAAVACTGDGASTPHFQPQKDESGVARAVAVSQPAATGLSPFSPDFAPNRPLIAGNPAQTSVSGGSPGGFTLAPASFRPVSVPSQTQQ